MHVNAFCLIPLNHRSLVRRNYIYSKQLWQLSCHRQWWINAFIHNDEPLFTVHYQVHPYFTKLIIKNSRCLQTSNMNATTSQLMKHSLWWNTQTCSWQHSIISPWMWALCKGLWTWSKFENNIRPSFTQLISSIISRSYCQPQGYSTQSPNDS